MAIKAAIAGMSTFQAISAAASVVSAFGQIKAGNEQARAYRRQAQQAEMAGRRDALKYQQEGIETLRRMRQNLSSVRARSGAAGLDPFSGTPASFARAQLSQGYDEYTMAQQNSALSLTGGTLQAAEYNRAASQAKTQGYLGAITNVGMSAAMLGQQGAFSGGGGVGDMMPAPGVATPSNYGVMGALAS